MKCRKCERPVEKNSEKYCRLHNKSNDRYRKNKIVCSKRGCYEARAEDSDLCKEHVKLRAERKLRKKKKKIETQLARQTMLNRKATGELYLWEKTQKQFKELKRTMG